MDTTEETAAGGAGAPARIIIRTATAGDKIAWRGLWESYLRFYRTDLPETVTQATWTRCLSDAWPMDCLVAVMAGNMVGFAIVVVHPGTWSRQSVACLEDLFIAPAARRQGVGKALIKALEARGRQFGWRRLYWRTRTEDRLAQALYDQLAERAGGVRYELDLG